MGLLNLNNKNVPVLMKILTWNYRGAGTNRFRRNLHELRNNHIPNVIILLETKVTHRSAENICNALGFAGIFCVPASERARGI